MNAAFLQASILRLTRSHATRRTSPLQTWSYRAWKRLPEGRLAAAQRRSRRCRTSSSNNKLAGAIALTGIPSRLPALRHTHRRGPSLPRRYATPRSPVLRPPRTPAQQRPLSPSAHTKRLAATTATKTGLSCSAPLLERVLRPLPRRDPPSDPVPTRRTWPSP